MARARDWVNRRRIEFIAFESGACSKILNGAYYNVAISEWPNTSGVQ
jgi:hypothetical protein